MKSQQAPFDPDRGELEAVERKRRETSSHFSKEGKEEEKEGRGEKEEGEDEIETFGCLHIIMCLAPQ